MKLTPLYNVHLQLGAQMYTSAAGYQMPAVYTSVADEHAAVRQRAGMLDLCLMAQNEIKGKDALAMMQRLAVANVRRLKDGQMLYTTLCNPAGRVVDDITLWRFGPEHYLVATPSTTRRSTGDWLREHARGLNAYVTDISSGLGMITVQGPRARDLLKRVSDIDYDSLKFFHFASGRLGKSTAVVARAGFSGELGYECYLDMEDVSSAWKTLEEAGREFRLQPYGMDTLEQLRLEKCFIFYGLDCTIENTPFEVGLDKWIDFDKGDFIGRDALLKAREAGPPRLWVGLELAGDQAARAKAAVKAGDREVGYVTSGFKGITPDKNLALAFVSTSCAMPGTRLSVAVDGLQVEATVVPKPFYDPRMTRTRM